MKASISLSVCVCVCMCVHTFDKSVCHLLSFSHFLETLEFDFSYPILPFVQYTVSKHSCLQV